MPTQLPSNWRKLALPSKSSKSRSTREAGTLVVSASFDLKVKHPVWAQAVNFAASPCSTAVEIT